MLNYLRQLTLGPGDTPDIGVVVLCFAEIFITCGFCYNGLHDKHFQLLDYCGAQSVIIPLYNIALGIRGAIGKGN